MKYENEGENECHFIGNLKISLPQANELEYIQPIAAAEFKYFIILK